MDILICSTLVSDGSLIKSLIKTGIHSIHELISVVRSFLCEAGCGNIYRHISEDNLKLCSSCFSNQITCQCEKGVCKVVVSKEYENSNKFYCHSCFNSQFIECYYCHKSFKKAKITKYPVCYNEDVPWDPMTSRMVCDSKTCYRAFNFWLSGLDELNHVTNDVKFEILEYIGQNLRANICGRPERACDEFDLYCCSDNKQDEYIVSGPQYNTDDDKMLNEATKRHEKIRKLLLRHNFVSEKDLLNLDTCEVGCCYRFPIKGGGCESHSLKIT